MKVVEFIQNMTPNDCFSLETSDPSLDYEYFRSPDPKKWYLEYTPTAKKQFSRFHHLRYSHCDR
jgi:hypothetical protein